MGLAYARTCSSNATASSCWSAGMPAPASSNSVRASDAAYGAMGAAGAGVGAGSLAPALPTLVLAPGPRPAAFDGRPAAAADPADPAPRARAWAAAGGCGMGGPEMMEDTLLPSADVPDCSAPMALPGRRVTWLRSLPPPLLPPLLVLRMVPVVWPSTEPVKDPCSSPSSGRMTEVRNDAASEAVDASERYCGIGACSTPPPAAPAWLAWPAGRARWCAS